MYPTGCVPPKFYGLPKIHKPDTPLRPSVKPKAGGKLSITVYRKPTHMDQYLQWDGHHHLSAKFSVINTLTHRDKTVCSILSISAKKWITSGRHSSTVNTLSGL